MENTKKCVETFIKNGGKCGYRNGLAYRGAALRDITKEKALELLPKYNFGMGFYSLSWLNIKGETVLEFQELDANDMY